MTLTDLIGYVKHHIPIWNEIVIVFSFLVFASFSYNISTFLYNLPSDLLSSSPAEIAVIFFYEMSFALLESLMACGILLLLCLIFPRRWFCQGFGYKGFLISLAGASGTLLLHIYPKMPTREALFVELALGLAFWLVSMFFLDNRPKRQNAFLSIIERFDIFAYLYIPLGVIGVIVILVRNLF
jgi:hypothetical protein